MPVFALLLGIALQSATIIDVDPYTPHRESAISSRMFILAVQIGDMIYSAEFRLGRKLMPGDFTSGEQVAGFGRPRIMLPSDAVTHAMQARFPRRDRVRHLVRPGV